MTTAIKIEYLSKQYRLGLVSTRTLSHDLNRWWTMNIRGKDDPYLKIGEVNDRTVKGESEYIWALRDINLEVEQGEVLGIIGKNGAGKSTLLKILSKVTAPTIGTIKARGRIASLLEVGTGFHPEMTGRENIFMNGAILGMTKAEIQRKFDEIVDFAGVEKFIDTPVKRYSSGMLVRLGFAVAAHLEPEILVVDEVLALGDAEFQKKAVGKMEDISRFKKRTILFVSHNMGSISTLCKSTIVLNKGNIISFGPTDQMISEYLQLGKLNKGQTSDYSSVNQNKKLKIRQISIMNDKGLITSELKNSEAGFVEIVYEIFKEEKGYNVGFELYNTQSGCIFSSSLKDEDVTKFENNTQKVGIHKYRIPLPMEFLREGEYWIMASSAVPKTEVLDEYKFETSFSIIDLTSPVAKSSEGRRGCVLPILKWNKI